MQDIRFILILLSGLALAACQAPGEVEDRLVAAFGETMFGGHAGADSGTSDPPVLLRWRSPVAVSIAEGATAANTALVSEKLARIEALSGLDVSLTSPGDQRAPITLFFTDKKSFVINDNQVSSCFASTAGDDEGNLTGARVHIARAENDGWRTDCLVHELLHAFGWRGHTHSIRSVISYMHGEEDMTVWDEYLMRALYDPRLAPGMSKQDAMPRVRLIMHEYLANR